MRKSLPPSIVLLLLRRVNPPVALIDQRKEEAPPLAARPVPFRGERGGGEWTLYIISIAPSCINQAGNCARLRRFEYADVTGHKSRVRVQTRLHTGDDYREGRGGRGILLHLCLSSPRLSSRPRQTSYSDAVAVRPV